MESEPAITDSESHMREPAHRLTHLFFVAGVALKGFFGVLDTLGGLLFFSTSAVTNLIRVLVQHELGEDPTDFFASRIYEALPSFSVHTQLFVAWYFLIHGVLNLILVISLLRKKLWAYPAYMVVLCFFALYQLYRFTHTHSLTLLLVTLFDVTIIWFIWREYKFVRHTYAGH